MALSCRYIGPKSLLHPSALWPVRPLLLPYFLALVHCSSLCYGLAHSWSSQRRLNAYLPLSIADQCSAHLSQEQATFFANLPNTVFKNPVLLSFTFFPVHGLTFPVLSLLTHATHLCSAFVIRSHFQFIHTFFSSFFCYFLVSIKIVFSHSIFNPSAVLG